MAGWAQFAGLAAIAAAVLAGYRFPKGLATFALAAICLGAAGYAWQGRPAWAGRPVAPRVAMLAVDDDTVGLRNAMFGRYGATALYYTPADAMMRYDAPDSAARMLQGGINRYPNDPGLWTQLGFVIATRDHAVSPAALFAFRRAAAVAPSDPGPWFFLGLARVRSGEFDEAKVAWARAASLTPFTASYRAEIVARLLLLDRLLAARRN